MPKKKSPNPAQPGKPGFGLKNLKSAIAKVTPFADTVANSESTQQGGFIPTPVYLLNAAFSGSLLGGVPDNKMIQIVGESGTYKTNLILGIVRQAILKRGFEVVWIDTEKALDVNIVSNAGLDIHDERFQYVTLPNNTVEEYRSLLAQIMNELVEAKRSGETITPIMIVTDSIGALSTAKTENDMTNVEGKADFTKAKLLTSTFNSVRAKVGYLGMPFIFTNHIYADLTNPYAEVQIKGGNAMLYMPDVIIALQKLKAQEDHRDSQNSFKELEGRSDGIKIRARSLKNRLVKPNKLVSFEVSLTKKNNPYAGLEIFCTPENFNITGVGRMKRKVDESTGEEYFEGGGNKWFVKHLDRYVTLDTIHTPQVFTPKVIKAIDTIVRPYFQYNSDVTELSEDGDAEEIPNLETPDLDGDFTVA